MRKSGVLLLFLFLWVIHPSFSQEAHPPSAQRIKGSIRGKVVDSAGKQVLGDATVSVTPDRDSTEAEYAIADKSGNFGFRNLNPGNYRLLITFEGYRHISRRFTITAANKDIDLATINMQRATDILQEVVIQRPPMQIKKDTVEYNAESFATKPNAVAEDQLRKLPGVQVDASGNIVAQGEKVQR